MSNSLLYIIGIICIVYILSVNFGIWAALGFLAVILLLFLWNRRVLFITQRASAVYMNEGDKETAEALYEKAYRTGKMSADCKISYSAFCLREKRFEKGKQLLNEVINSNKTSPADKVNARHNFSILVWREGNLDKAVEIMENVCQSGKKTGVYGTMGVLYLEKVKRDGTSEKILDFLLEAYDYDPCDKTIADNLGEFYIMTAEYEKAKEVYEKLLENPVTSPVPYYNYGRLLKIMGDKEGARENFEKALDCRFTSIMTVAEQQVQEELDSLKN